jgi:hypothetical protein
MFDSENLARVGFTASTISALGPAVGVSGFCGVEFGQIQFGEPISAVLVAAEGELSESVGVLLLDTGTGDDAGSTGPRRTVFSGDSRGLLP